MAMVRYGLENAEAKVDRVIRYRKGVLTQWSG